VVAAAGGAQKLSLAGDLGADTLVDYTRAGWANRIRDELPGGLDVVFDGVGGQIGEEAFALLRGGGRFCGFGLSSGTFAQVDAQAASTRDISVLRMVPPSREELRSLSLTALDHAVHGRLRPVVGQTFPLGQAAEAHAAIEQRATLGKTLLVVR
jgi:NADPH2:quinone reductase